MRTKNRELCDLLSRAAVSPDYFIKDSEMCDGKVSIFRVNEDTSISQMMEFLTRKEMKAFLIGYIHGKNNIL